MQTWKELGGKKKQKKKSYNSDKVFLEAKIEFFFNHLHFSLLLIGLKYKALAGTRSIDEVKLIVTACHVWEVRE